MPINKQELEAAYAAYFESQKPVRDFNYAAQDFLKENGIKISGMGNPFFADLPIDWDTGEARALKIEMSVYSCRDGGNLEEMERHARDILKCVEFVRQYRSNLTK